MKWTYPLNTSFVREVESLEQQVRMYHTVTIARTIVPIVDGTGVKLGVPRFF